MRNSTVRAQQPGLFQEPYLVVSSTPQQMAVECEEFPFEHISQIAELESWRKEINRPLSHIHKWWAQRLGSVFRAVVIGALSPKGSNVLRSFYLKNNFKNAIVYDPFMGSGTTLVEAVKVGARAIGRDINPVAYFLVKNALPVHSKEDIIKEFNNLQDAVASNIQKFYTSKNLDGTSSTVLYYFWVKQVECPTCLKSVDLFSSYVFARHAYTKKYPQAHATCPSCNGINKVNYDATYTTCTSCKLEYNPSQGSARGQKAICSCCMNEFSIVKAVRSKDTPPTHKMYAKLVLNNDGTKEYKAISDEDLNSYIQASKLLKTLNNPYPMVAIEPGENTSQALGYNYRYWHQFFNDRQLLCLAMLGQEIQKIESKPIRDLFTCLLSGTLEFNNMFASYKGEGTGAVRHMFSHHILKPERMPLEANVWGTSKSSGSFSSLFKSRILKAIEYAENPFELNVSGEKAEKKVYGISYPLGSEIADNYEKFVSGTQVYLSCGDSSSTDIDSKSVDVVITDPPFFDNVHYSELADFFYVWQKHFEKNQPSKLTTRDSREVQHSKEAEFRDRLQGVFSESIRVLKDEGLLIFSYHHSRTEGWRSTLQALMQAGLIITAVHPVKAEMSVATPKQQAKEPIDLDILIVCRKRSSISSWKAQGTNDIWANIIPLAESQIRRLRSVGRALSRNDVRVIIMAQLIGSLSKASNAKLALDILDKVSSEIEIHIQKLKEMA